MEISTSVLSQKKKKILIAWAKKCSVVSLVFLLLFAYQREAKVSPGISSLESRGQRREGKLPSENAKGEKTTPTLLFPSHFCPPHSPFHKMCQSLLLLLLLMVLLFFVGLIKEQFVY